MALWINVDGHDLLLPNDFSIEWEENNYCFEDDSVYGDYSIPVEVSTKGNEKAIGFLHELNTPDRVTVLTNATCGDGDNVIYRGSLAVLNVNRLRVSFSFLVHDIAYLFGDKKLNELELPEVSLGTSDATVLAEAKASIADDTKLYCFPPIKVNDFYGDSLEFPGTINGNFYGSTTYETADNFSKPLIPFFRLLNFLEFLFNSIGYSMTGDIRRVPELYFPVISALTSLDKSRNPNDVKYGLEDYTLCFPNPNTDWKRSLGHTANIPYFKTLPDVLIEEDTIFIISYDFGLPSYDNYPTATAEGGFRYSIDVRIVLSDDEYGSTGREIILATTTYTNGGAGFFGGDSLKGVKTFRHNPTPAQVGKYIFIETKGTLGSYRNNNPGSIYDPFPTYTLIANYPFNFPNCNPTFAIRYLGTGSSILLDNKLDWNFLLPETKVSEFLANVRQDFNLRLSFHPFRKEVEVNLAKDLIVAPIRKLSPFVNKNYELKVNTAVKGYVFNQDFDTETDPDKEESLKYKEFLGEFIGTSNFPWAVFNSYVVDSITNEVYVGVLTGDLTSFTYVWELSHQRVPIVEKKIGDGSKTVTAAFTPFLSKKDGSDYYLFFDGVGRSKYSGEKPDIKGFRMVNFFGIDATVSGWDEPYASRTRYYKDGTVINGAMNLSYDAADPNSIYSLMWARWVDFMLSREEFELLILHKELQEIDMGYRYELNGRLFLIKQLRKNRGVNGLDSFEATAFKINS